MGDGYAMQGGLVGRLVGSALGYSPTLSDSRPDSSRLSNIRQIEQAAPAVQRKDIFQLSTGIIILHIRSTSMWFSHSLVLQPTWVEEPG